MQAQVDTNNAREWFAQNLRATFFLTGEGSLKNADAWRHFAGTEPESITVHKGGAYREVGRFGIGQLQLTGKDARTDWLFSAVESKNPEVVTPEKIPIVEAFDLFFVSLRQWLPACPEFWRFAIGGTLYIPFSNPKEGRALFSEYVPELQVPIEASDLAAQMNLPRQSKAVDGLLINRITSWSYASFVRAKVIASQTLPAGTIVEDSEDIFQVEFDINTSAESKDPPPRKLILRLFDELAEMARQVIKHGGKHE